MNINVHAPVSAPKEITIHASVEKIWQTQSDSENWST